MPALTKRSQSQIVVTVLAVWITGTPTFAQPQVSVGRAVVVSETEHASRVGRDVLRDGGSAVDAAVATALALAVTWPEAGNLGGGGFMMVLPGPGTSPVCIEYREQAPAAAHRDTFRIDDSKHSWKIVGVPGTVRGLQLAHEKFGRLPWKRLVDPSVMLAKNGFVVDRFLARSLNYVLRDTATDTTEFAALHAAYGCPHGRPWKAGDRLRLPDLAATLKAIAGAPDAIYRGEFASRLASAMKQGGGLITVEDLAAYRAKVRAPIHGTFRGYDVWGPPPPSSGGICLIQALNMLETFDLRREPTLSTRNVHLRAEVMKRVFVDRARHLGDQDFVSIPSHLTTKEYARKLASGIDPQWATPSVELAGDIALTVESDNTTHFSVMDDRGMVVSNTYTLEASWGSRRIVPGLGFVLNNEMGDFNWIAGRTDLKGRIGTKPNLIEPGKRMLSSQTPTLVTKSGQPVLAVGSPGGRTIINTVLGIVVDVLEHGQTLPHAVAQPRLHHGWLPDVLRFEGAKRKEFKTLVQALTDKRHHLTARAQGSAHCIAVLPDGQVQGVADFRRGGSAQAIE